MWECVSFKGSETEIPNRLLKFDTTLLHIHMYVAGARQLGGPQFSAWIWSKFIFKNYIYKVDFSLHRLLYFQI